jgi:NAD(P)H-hydrate epimerase
MKIVKRDEMRAIEQFAIDEVGISGAVLMEIAGNQVAEEIIRSYPDRSAPIVILIGSGNNGGDGFVIARRLSDAGYTPAPWLLVDPGKLKGDALVQYRIHTARELPLHSVEEGLGRLDAALASSDVIVDAMLGTGISGAVRAPFDHVIDRVNSHAAHVYAVDLPSGLDCDTGRVENVAVRADETITFAFPKLGFFTQDGPSVIGRLAVKDISVPGTLADRIGMKLPELVTEQLAVQALPGRAEFGHKGTFGHALIIGGSRPFVGAPLYSAHAAYKTGAGLVTLAIPEGIYPAVAGQNQLALLRSLPEADGHFSGAGVEAELFEKVNAVAIGPGLGRFDGGEAFIEEIIRQLDGQPIIIDADGLHHVKGRLGLLARYDGPVILTPHPGEMANLTDRTVADIEGDRMGVAKDFAEKYQVNLVLKGHRTIIATPERLWVNPHGNDALAKGGSGDILTGMIAAFLAQGAEAAEAMQIAVYLHATAGERAAGTHSHYGVTPGDVIEAAKGILKEMEEKK